MKQQIRKIEWTEMSQIVMNTLFPVVKNKTRLVLDFSLLWFIQLLRTRFWRRKALEMLPILILLLVLVKDLN